MKKKILTLGLVAVLSAAAAISGTLAYFTDKEEKTNKFTVGNVNIELKEDHWDPDKATHVYPGQVLEKDPVVTNIGSNECYVRVEVTNLKQFGTEGDIVYISTEKNAEKTVDIEGKLGANWVFDADASYKNGEDSAYFYYTEPLKPNENTTALFEKIKMPTGLTNRPTPSDAEHNNAESIVITAWAAQAEGIDWKWDAKKQDISGLKAWFEACFKKN